MRHEYVGNLHLHTTLSDGNATPEEIARIAEDAGLDFVVPTDHDVYTPGLDGWYGKTLLLMGQEVAVPPPGKRGNHFLVMGVSEDMSRFAGSPQELVDAVAERGGLGFIAHPFERAAPAFGQPALPWWDWDVSGYTGISLWNYMSEFKGYLSSLPKALLAAFFPTLFIRGPYAETLEKWDRLLAARRLPIVGGSDAHGETYTLGPLRRQVFPYGYLFRCVNMHILLPQAFSGNWGADARAVYEAVGHGASFLAYDLIGESRGFSFTAHGDGATAGIGDELPVGRGAWLEVASPLAADLHLIWQGRTVAHAWGKRLAFRAERAGAYRVEAYRWHGLHRCGWVFTNPIYLKGDGR